MTFSEYKFSGVFFITFFEIHSFGRILIKCWPGLRSMLLPTSFIVFFRTWRIWIHLEFKFMRAGRKKKTFLISRYTFLCLWRENIVPEGDEYKATFILRLCWSNRSNTSILGDQSPIIIPCLSLSPSLCLSFFAYHIKPFWHMIFFRVSPSGLERPSPRSLRSKNAP